MRLVALLVGGNAVTLRRGCCLRVGWETGYVRWPILASVRRWERVRLEGASFIIGENGCLLNPMGTTKERAGIYT